MKTKRIAKLCKTKGRVKRFKYQEVSTLTPKPALQTQKNKLNVAVSYDVKLFCIYAALLFVLYVLS